MRNFVLDKENSRIILSYIRRIFCNIKHNFYLKTIWCSSITALGQWIYEKYPFLFENAKTHTEIEIPLCTVMPSVTPVCFGTMYTGAQPDVHGIKAYEKPVITIDTIFDALIRAGKKPVIIAYGNASLAKIYLEREMDYFYFDTVEQVNAKTSELILKD